MKLLKLSEAQVRAVTHHEDIKQFLAYYKPWSDPEEDCHLIRSFNLFSTNNFNPPLAHSVPNILTQLQARQPTMSTTLEETCKYFKFICPTQSKSDTFTLVEFCIQGI